MSIYFINEITASNAGPDIVRSHLLCQFEPPLILYRIENRDFIHDTCAKHHAHITNGMVLKRKKSYKPKGGERERKGCGQDRGFISTCTYMSRSVRRSLECACARESMAEKF